MDNALPTEAKAVLEFWFAPIGSAAYGQRRDEWFKNKTAAFDDAIRERFLPLWELARGGAFAHWDESPRSLLAYIIVCDQFPRNMFRADPRAFATDPHALAAARRMIARSWERSLLPNERLFVYLPYEHSESLVDQADSVALYREFRGNAEGDNSYDYAVRHQAVIMQFGRFPHRNAALGRASTPEEIEYLAQPGAGF